MRDALERLRDKVIEKHARRAVLEVQNQGDNYTPTADEANLLVNMRHILRQFADELPDVIASLPQGQETPLGRLLCEMRAEYAQGGDRRLLHYAERLSEIVNQPTCPRCGKVSDAPDSYCATCLKRITRKVRPASPAPSSQTEKAT